MERTLTIQFTAQDVQQLNANGTSVVIGKSTKKTAPNVAWLTFAPMESNTITWTEEYGIYVSSTEISNGASVNFFATVPAPIEIDELYMLQTSGSITGPTPGGIAGVYNIVNDFTGMVFFSNPAAGLLQNATVDGSKIVGNAIVVAAFSPQSKLTFSPAEEIYIWLQQQAQANTVVTEISPSAAKLSYEVDKEHTVMYDSSTGSFKKV